MEDEISGLLAKHAIERLPPNSGLPLFRSSIFLTAKKDGSWRPILNLKPLNKAFVRPKTFRMETLQDITPHLHQGMWASSIDLKDAYLHIPIHQLDRRFLAFNYRDTDYQFRVLPFGLSTAPRVFTRVTRAILNHLRRAGITLFAYLDDWLVIADSLDLATRYTATTTTLLRDLGWVINLDKSQLLPSQHITYLGAEINLASGTIAPSRERSAALLVQARRVYNCGQATAHQWQILLGRMASLVNILQLCLLRMRPLQWLLRDQFTQGDSAQSTVVFLPLECRPFLFWWTQESNVTVGRPLQDNRPSTTVTTDASLSGWGATRNNYTVAGLWTPSERLLHINALEMEAVFRAISHWQDDLRRHRVTVFSDNSTTVSYINREGGTRSRPLFKATLRLLNLCEILDLRLRATHLAGKLNVVADALSRGKINHNEWSLATAWANHIFSLFGRPHVDLFATAENARLPTFCSRTFHPTAWETDAFSFPWDNLSVYAFPPFGLVNRVLTTLQRYNTDLILIAPCWPNQVWFPLLIQFLVDRPLRFPPSPTLLSQCKGRLLHTDLQSLHLAAWKLSSLPSKQRAFHHELLQWQQTPAGSPRLELTIPDLTRTGSGATSTLTIPWRLP